MSNTITLSAPPITDALVEKPRLASIDTLRGLIMVIMALDHVRDFFHTDALINNPVDLNTTAPVLFFTRWITHFCAPTFVFLAGLSIFISSQRKSKSDLSMFLLSRGLWLIFLEVTVIRFGFVFNMYFDITFFQVIWVIGGSMVCMAGLIHLKKNIVLVIGLLLVFGHNATDAIQLQAGDPMYGVWVVLRQTGFLALTPQNSIFVVYPLLPWLGIMILGYSVGRLYRGYAAKERQSILLKLGIGAVFLFVALRALNVYGDPAPWSQQKNFAFTAMSFLNATKYPVSLLYTLMTLGPALIVLAFLERVKTLQISNPLAIFGRVPLFYFIIHFYVIHVAALLFFMNKTGKSLSEIDFHFSQSFGGITAEGGYSLGVTYLVWISLVLLLYPLCRWYNRYKSTHTDKWLSYL
jgi:uncharacterized membrane protein